MSTPTTKPKRGLLDGLDTLINNALPAPKGYASKTTALELNRREQPFPDLTTLVESLWRQIVVNWVEGGCQSRGESNWRWKLLTEKGESEGQAEVGLQRRIARFIESEGQGKHWSNETPTGSGLSEGASGDPGGLDFAHSDGDGGVVLIELKVGSNTPISAAFQIVQYGLMLTMARLVDKQNRIISEDIENNGDVWRNAKHAHLRVLAPASFYSRFLGLQWFEERLDAAVGDFGDVHALPMTFGFREFDPANLEPTKVSELVERLGEKGKIPWK